MGWGRRWEAGGSFKREQTCVYLWQIHVDVQQKPTKHCKATIIQKNKTKQNKTPEIATALPLQQSIDVIRRKKIP